MRQKYEVVEPWRLYVIEASAPTGEVAFGTQVIASESWAVIATSLKGALKCWSEVTGLDNPRSCVEQPVGDVPSGNLLVSLHKKADAVGR